jgi:hypothetical protein
MCCNCGGGCLDEETSDVDENGNGCAYYSSVPTACGDHDTSDFEAEELCCACQLSESESYSESTVTATETESVSETEEYSESESETFDLSECEDAAGDATDSGGDGCEWYIEYFMYCGSYDTDDFIANEMCCVCEEYDVEHHYDWYSDCENSADGATDSYGDGCDWYDDNQSGCGYYDTPHFIADEMCCACSVSYSDWEDEWESEFSSEVSEEFSDFNWEDWFGSDSGSECEDTADGATDSYGDGCEWYDFYPTECGYYDTDDF